MAKKLCLKTHSPCRRWGDTELPSTLISLSLEFVTFRELASSQSVCHGWQLPTVLRNSLWKLQYKRDWCKKTKTNKKTDDNWAERYRVRWQRMQLSFVIGCALDCILQDTNRELPDEEVSLFHSESLPDLTAGEYFSRLLHQLPNVSGSAAIGAVALVRRIAADEGAGVPLDQMTAHRLLLAAVATASKAWDVDSKASDEEWSDIGGVSLEEFQSLEAQFVGLLQHRLLVPLDDYLRTYAELCGASAHPCRRKCELAEHCSLADVPMPKYPFGVA